MVVLTSIISRSSAPETTKNQHVELLSQCFTGNSLKSREALRVLEKCLDTYKNIRQKDNIIKQTLAQIKIDQECSFAKTEQLLTDCRNYAVAIDQLSSDWQLLKKTSIKPCFWQKENNHLEQLKIYCQGLDLMARTTILEAVVPIKISR